MASPTFSVVIPAFDEEKYLPACLAAVAKAAEKLGEEVEVVVSDNMSNDRTVEVAKAAGAKVTSTPIKCISAVRNAGIRAATGKYLVFVDADDMMSENMLVEIKRVMDTGRYVGGGTARVLSDRWSAGIAATYALQVASYVFSRLSLFLFYTTKEAAEAIGGFNEELLSSEDWDFAYRLKKHGKGQGLRYHNMWRGSVMKSARKFDEFGDWFIFLNPVHIIRAVFNDRDAVYDLWYRPRR
jgi:glycosyltransferase involved in cell wall biosynthesis